MRLTYVIGTVLVSTIMASLVYAPTPDDAGIVGTKGPKPVGIVKDGIVTEEGKTIKIVFEGSTVVAQKPATIKTITGLDLTLAAGVSEMSNALTAPTTFTAGEFKPAEKAEFVVNGVVIVTGTSNADVNITLANGAVVAIGKESQPALVAIKSAPIGVEILNLSDVTTVKVSTGADKLVIGPYVLNQLATISETKITGSKISDEDRLKAIEIAKKQILLTTTPVATGSSAALSAIATGSPLDQIQSSVVEDQVKTIEVKYLDPDDNQAHTMILTYTLTQ